MIKISYNKERERLQYDLTENLYDCRHTYSQTVDNRRLVASGYGYLYNSYDGFEIPRMVGSVSQYLSRKDFKLMLKLLEANNLEYQIKYLPEKVRL